MGIFGLFKKNPKQDQIDKVTNENPISPTTKQRPHDNNLSDQPIAQRRKPSIKLSENIFIEPAENRSMDAIPSKRGLFPHEILVLNFAPNFYPSGNTFQRFWLYKYGIQDVQSILSSLYKRGFIGIGNLQSTLEQQTASQLKSMLEEYGCKTTGTKNELVKRVLEEIPEHELSHRFPKYTYILTEIGQAEIKEQDYILFSHNNGFSLDIWSFNKLMQTEPQMAYGDKLWGYFNEQSMKNFYDKNFQQYRNCRYDMALFLKQEKKYDLALERLAEVAFCDLSGLGNGYSTNYFELYASSFFPYERSIAKVSSKVVANIAACQKLLNYSDDVLWEKLRVPMNRLTLPIQLFSVEECAHIVILERDENIAALKKLYNKAKNELKQQYPEIEIDKPLPERNENIMRFKNLGIDTYEFLCCLDYNTCQICAILDGERYNVDGAVVGVNCPPMHEGCRCFAYPILSPDHKHNARAARNPLTKKSETTTAQNYLKWEKTLSEDERNALKKKRGW